MAADPRANKMFDDMQTKLVEDRSNIKVLEAQIASKEIANKKLGLTQMNIAPLADDVHTFAAVGRMFLAQPKPEILKDLAKNIEENNKELDDMKQKKTYLDRAYKESEDSFRELIVQYTKKK